MSTDTVMFQYTPSIEGAEDLSSSPSRRRVATESGAQNGSRSFNSHPLEEGADHH